MAAHLRETQGKIANPLHKVQQQNPIGVSLEEFNTYPFKKSPN